MIDIEQSREIAQRELEAMPTSQPLRLSDEVIDRPGYWVWGYNTVAYFETGNPLLGALGRGPIAVAKDDGSTMWLAGALRIEDQV